MLRVAVEMAVIPDAECWDLFRKSYAQDVNDPL
jgi:hypothetical protein